MDIKLDADGDIAIEYGDLVLITGNEAIAQDITIRLQWFLGEWFLDQRLGMPYMQKLLGQKTNIAAIKEIFRKAIMTTPGLIEIKNYIVSFDGPTRALTVRFDALGEEGPFVYDKELIV